MHRLPLLALLLLAAAPANPQSMSPAARVAENKIVHASGQDKATVSVPRRATYVGALRFPLYRVADCELHVFVEAKRDRTVQRLYWVQFESYLPSLPRLSYDYAAVGDQRMQFWGHPTWINTSFAPTSEPPRSGSDTEQVRMLLQRAGYRLPAEMMQVRFVRLLDDPQGTGRGRSELMLIYAEDMGAMGQSSTYLRTNPERWAAVASKLISRAGSNFSVEVR